MAKGSRNSPRRILEIIEAICMNPEAATATRLSHILDIPVPTIYRWLERLSEERFIAANAAGYFVPGERFREMILSSMQHEPAITIRRSILRKLSSQLDETVNLSIPQGMKLIYFDRLETNWPFQSNLKVGSPLPLHCCASGKLYLSTLKPRQAMDVFARVQDKKRARGTITNPRKFADELELIRQNGFSLDIEEWYDDMVGAAVPIWSDKGTLIACLSTHLLKTRKTMDEVRGFIDPMQKAVVELKSCLL